MNFRYKVSFHIHKPEMSFNFEYELFNKREDDIHDDDCLISYGCVCENITGEFKIKFRTIYGPNLQYKFETMMTFFMNRFDRKNLKKFISVLKNPEKINEIVGKSKEKIDQIYANQDRTDLTLNRRLYYNSKDETLTFDFKQSRYNSNGLTFNLKDREIILHSRDDQCCGHFCSCGDCEYYGRFGTSLNVCIPFKTETSPKIIEAFEDVYDYLEYEY